MLQRHIRAVLDRAPAGRITVISVCSGQGHDLLGVLADHPRRQDVVARLVELDTTNVEIARSTARRLGLDGISVLEADAGTTDAYVGAAPVSLVILAGFFTFLDDADIDRMIELLPQLCAVGAAVVWARGTTGSNNAAHIRELLRRAQFVELDTEELEQPALHVGVARFTGTPVTLEPGTRIFTFRHPNATRTKRMLRRLRRIRSRARSSLRRLR